MNMPTRGSSQKRRKLKEEAVRWGWLYTLVTKGRECGFPGIHRGGGGVAVTRKYRAETSARHGSLFSLAWGGAPGPAGNDCPAFTQKSEEKPLPAPVPPAGDAPSARTASFGAVYPNLPPRGSSHRMNEGTTEGGRTSALTGSAGLWESFAPLWS